MFSYFDTVPSCDGQTYRATANTALFICVEYALPGKKCTISKEKKFYNIWLLLPQPETENILAT